MLRTLLRRILYELNKLLEPRDGPVAVVHCKFSSCEQYCTLSCIHVHTHIIVRVKSFFDDDDDVDDHGDEGDGSDDNDGAGTLFIGSCFSTLNCVA